MPDSFGRPRLVAVNLAPAASPAVQARASRPAVTPLPVKIARHAPGAAVLFGEPSRKVRARAMPIWSATNGFRVFGWTHAYTLPFAIERLERARGAAAPRETSTR